MRALPSIAIVVLASSCFALASSRTQRARGAAVFSVSGCQHCHTINHAGGHKGPDLSGVGRKKSKAAMRQQIVYGSKVMPAFGNVLEPDELNDLIAYLRSCREKPAKPAPAADSN
ncbi:MAG: cytochrome c [Terracidiphilus sp.]